MEADLGGRDAKGSIDRIDQDRHLEGVGVLGGLMEPGEATYDDTVTEEDGARAGAGRFIDWALGGQDELRRVGDDCIHRDTRRIRIQITAVGLRFFGGSRMTRKIRYMKRRVDLLTGDLIAGDGGKEQGVGN